MPYSKDSKLFAFSSPTEKNAGCCGLADESAGEAIGEKWFHYTLDNREASKRQLPLFTLLNTLSVGPHKLVKPPIVSEPHFP